MSGHESRAFTISDLIDYELQLALDNRVQAEELVRRDKALRLEGDILRKDKAAGLKVWLQKVRGPYGERFLQLRQILSLVLIVFGALLGWGTVQGLLNYNGQHPVNVLPFLAVFVLLPLLFITILLLRGFFARLFGRLPRGWAAASNRWLLAHVISKYRMNLPVTDVWHRLKSLHPLVFTWQAWILSQSFALAFYLTALGAFLFHMSVNDYAFAWQTTLRIGPEALLTLVQTVGLPFSWLGPELVPSANLIQATQYDRFAGVYADGAGHMVTGEWWPFLAALIGFYGCLPRLLLLLFFQARLRFHLRSLRFDDFQSQELWLRLQRNGMSWEATEGTKEMPLNRVREAANMQITEPLMVLRWRQAPFGDDELRTYFKAHGHSVGPILDAEGRESEYQVILRSLKEGQAVAFVCDPWELPGEAFNRLRLAMREAMPVRTPIFLVPLQHNRPDAKVEAAEQDRPLWEASLKAFRDPYVGLLLQRSHSK